MPAKIRVAILDDHLGMIDGYCYRLSSAEDIEVVATATYGEAIETLLAENQVDVLFLDVAVPATKSDSTPYPILYVIPKFQSTYPNMSILIISMHASRALIKAVLEAGASGYILKDDQESIRNLASIVRLVAGGDIYLSPQASELLKKRQTGGLASTLTSRQLEALSICASYPDLTLDEMAKKMSIAGSTMRNLLSAVYIKLGVGNKAAAIAAARDFGLVDTKNPTPPSLKELGKEHAGED